MSATDVAGPGRVPLALRLFVRLNALIYHLSNGRLMNKVLGTPICIVTMTGHTSGRRLTLPLTYNQDGSNVILVASMAGAPKHPHWYFNLLAHPDIEIQLGSVKHRMRARQTYHQAKMR